MGITDDRDDPCLREVRPNGQQECYLVLSEAERAKGFSRPVRRTYRHKRCGHTTTMSLAIAETYARDPFFYGGTFCCHCGGHFRLVDEDGPAFLWAPGGVSDGTHVGE